MKRFVSIVIAVCVLCSFALAFSACGEKTYELSPYFSEHTVMYKEKGKDFVILNLTDTQINDTYASDGFNTYETIQYLVDEVKPDLITITGDVFGGLIVGNAVPRFVEYMEGLGIPWAPTLGNHDQEAVQVKKLISDSFENAENCLFSAGTVSGKGNYVINLVEKDSQSKEKQRIVYQLLFLDSFGKVQYSAYGEEYAQYGYDYGFIQPDQVQWYKDMTAKAQLYSTASVPSMSFFHIPLPEFDDAYDAWEESGFSEEIGVGVKRESTAPAQVNSGLFAAAKEAGTTHIIVGHEHINNYFVDYQGVKLCYALKTGDCSYNDDDLNGGTVIRVTDDGVTLENVSARI